MLNEIINIKGFKVALVRCFPLHFLFITLLVLLSSCASMNFEYEEPSIELVSLKILPAKGFEQNFEVGLKLTNPNNFELPFNGISYQLFVAGEVLAHGVTSNIPTVPAYGESRFKIPVSTSLFRGIKVVRALLKTQQQNINYQLQADLNIDIPLMPTFSVIQEGIIPLSNKPK